MTWQILTLSKSFSLITLLFRQNKVTIPFLSHFNINLPFLLDNTRCNRIIYTIERHYCQMTQYNRKARTAVITFPNNACIYQERKLFHRSINVTCTIGKAILMIST